MKLACGGHYVRISTLLFLISLPEPKSMVITSTNIFLTNFHSFHPKRVRQPILALVQHWRLHAKLSLRWLIPLRTWPRLPKTSIMLMLRAKFCPGYLGYSAANNPHGSTWRLVLSSLWRSSSRRYTIRLLNVSDCRARRQWDPGRIFIKRFMSHVAECNACREWWKGCCLPGICSWLIKPQLQD